MLQLFNQLQTSTPAAVASAIITAVQEGEVDPLQAIAFLDSVKRIHDEVRKNIEDNVITELQKQGGTVKLQGVKITVAETGVKYDYSVSPQWLRLNLLSEAANEKRKEHEELIKKIKSSTTLVDEDTGESFSLSGIPKTSKTSFKIETIK